MYQPSVGSPTCYAVSATFLPPSNHLPCSSIHSPLPPSIHLSPTFLAALSAGPSSRPPIPKGSNRRRTDPPPSVRKALAGSSGSEGGGQAPHPQRHSAHSTYTLSASIRGASGVQQQQPQSRM